jgi:hypothetical protein
VQNCGLVIDMVGSIVMFPSNPPATTVASSEVILYMSAETVPHLRMVTSGTDRRVGLYCNTPTSGTGTQSIASTTRTYLAGSTYTVPPVGVNAGTTLTWHWNMVKTAAGSSPSTIDIAVGTAGTTADTARVSFTKPSGTNVIDTAACEVTAVVYPTGASCIITATFRLIHALATTGHANIPCVVVLSKSAAFDITTSTKIGLCFTAGTSDSLSIEGVSVIVSGG